MYFVPCESLNLLLWKNDKRLTLRNTMLSNNDLFSIRTIDQTVTIVYNIYNF